MRQSAVLPAGRRQGTESGFTLLELMLVVFILSALALTASAFVDNHDDQFRFEDTRRRLEMIRRAAVGEAAPVHDGQVVVSGFGADNGVLPTAVGDLLAAKPSGYADAGLWAPVFDATPNATDGRNDGVDETPLSGSAEKLEKGWRAGYLHAAPGSSVFKDGWGYDWTVAPGTPPGGVQFNSPGKNGTAGGVGKFDTDILDDIYPADWSVQIAGLTVRVRNQSGTDYSGRLRAALLVFENSAAGAKWKRYTSDAATCLDGNGDALVGGLPCASEATLTFPAGGYPGGSYASTRVPIGRHLLLLVSGPGTPHTADDAPYPSAAAPVSRLVSCFAAGCTGETLVLK